MNIVDIAEEEVKRAQAHKVDVIELQIGTMAGVELDALDFSWPAVVHNTVLEEAERIIDSVQAMGQCTNCGCEFQLTEAFQPCPACQDVFIKVLRGKELKVKSLTLS